MVRIRAGDQCRAEKGLTVLFDQAGTFSVLGSQIFGPRFFKRFIDGLVHCLGEIRISESANQGIVVLSR